MQAGTADATADGGVQVPFQTKIATDPNLKKNADDPVSSYVRYFAVFPAVKPLDNVHCRRAIFYAINKSDLQRARGGTTVATSRTPVASRPFRVTTRTPTRTRMAGQHR